MTIALSSIAQSYYNTLEVGSALMPLIKRSYAYAHGKHDEAIRLFVCHLLYKDNILLHYLVAVQIPQTHKPGAADDTERFQSACNHGCCNSVETSNSTYI